MVLKFLFYISFCALFALTTVDASKPRRLSHGLPEIQGSEIHYDEREMRVNHNGVFVRPIVIPVVKTSKILGYLVFAPIIKPQNWQDFPRIVAHIPDLRDALFCHMYGLFARLWTPHAKLDPKQILAQVGRVVQKHFPDGMIETVKTERVQFYKMIDGDDQSSLFTLSAFFPDLASLHAKSVLLH